MPDIHDARGRSSILGGLSWFQVVAGALAAMTSAWIASALGVGGTIIGAALGSLVVSISSSLYASTLDKGRTLIVQTDSGRLVETEVEAGHTAEALEAVREATHEEVTGAEVVDEPRRGLRWKAVALSTAVILAVSGVAMGAYELVTDRSYGSNGDNARIGNPFGGGSSTSERTPQPEPTTTTTPEPTQSPAPDEEATPTPTPTPTATATTPAPTPTPTPDPADPVDPTQ